MPELKTSFTRQQLDEYARNNQLDVLNVNQIAAKFMELESIIDKLSK